MKTTLLLVLIPVYCIPLYAQTAKELNDTGYGLYKEGKFEQALPYFERSFEADPDYYFPHYNYACTMGILIQNDICAWLGELKNLFVHLKKTVDLKPEYREKMQTDPDLLAVRHYYRFQVLTGLDPEVTEDVEKILVNANWFGPAPGIYGPVSGLDFNRDGSLSLWYLDHSSGIPEKKPIKGQFEINGNHINIHLNSSYRESREFKGILEQGRITFENLDYAFSDDDDPCGA